MSHSPPPPPFGALKFLSWLPLDGTGADTGFFITGVGVGVEGEGWRLNEGLRELRHHVGWVQGGV